MPTSGSVQLFGMNVSRSTQQRQHSFEKKKKNTKKTPPAHSNSHMQQLTHAANTRHVLVPLCSSAAAPHLPTGRRHGHNAV